jgi:hypothetical protein
MHHLDPYLEWLDALTAAIDVSMELEEREAPPWQQGTPRQRWYGQRPYSMRRWAGAGAERNAHRQEQGQRNGGEGKWNPQTGEDDAPTATAMAASFARRSAATLLRDAPRRTEYVISGGKRYRLAYEKGTLEPVPVGVTISRDSEDEEDLVGDPSAAQLVAMLDGGRLPKYEEIVGTGIMD